MSTEFIYGRNATVETLRANRRSCKRLLHAFQRFDDHRVDEIMTRCTDLGITITEVDRSHLDEIVDGSHQGVALECNPYPYATPESLLEDVRRDSIFLALDNLQDPRNVGSLLRTAEAVGVSGVVIPEHRAASITPAVSNASAGAVEHLRVARVTNLVRWLQSAKSNEIWVTGLDGAPATPSIFETDIPLPAVLVVGSEGSGIRRLVSETCDLRVSIPMYGQIESLNAAVAGSIALYEIREFAESS